MLAIELTLVRVASRTILAERRAMLAHAAPALVDHYAIAGEEVGRVAPDVLHHACDLVSEDLRFFVERDDASVRVAVVVRVSRDGVQVRTTQSAPRAPSAPLVRGGCGRWHIAQLQAIYAREHDGAHQRWLATRC